MIVWLMAQRPGNAREGTGLFLAGERVSLAIESLMGGGEVNEKISNFKNEGTKPECPLESTKALKNKPNQSQF